VGKRLRAKLGRRGAPLIGLAMLATLLQATPSPAATQTGFRAHSYAGFGAEDAGGKITGQKPESKLWFHDASWWAAMVSPVLAGAHTFHRLDDMTWVDTGVVIDGRPSTKEDVLSLGNTLYVMSRANGGIGQNQLRRFSYSNGQYALDSGFPVNAPGTNAETTTLGRDSLGNLWVTYEASGNVFVARTQGSDNQWGTPFVIPVPGATGISGDDISAVISFTDDDGPAIGVMWSNQTASEVSFAVHRDGAADNVWTKETALSGLHEADDHINLKAAEGRIYSVVKTSHDTGADPLIRLLVRSRSGTWSRHPVALVSEDNTRPITMLHLDPKERKAYVFMTIDSGVNSEGIAYKETSIDNISFPSQATVFIQGANGEPINDATSMKANSTAASGIVVMASDGSHYWWNRIGGSSSPPANAAPTASDASAATPADTDVTVTLSATDPETCELDFTLTSAPTNGTLGALTDEPCSATNPNSDSATVTYTPDAGFTGTDSFSFKASDGELDSNRATVTITVTEPGGGDISFVAASSAANATATTLTIGAPAGVSAGDVMVASIDVRGKPAITPPAGWTLIRSDVNGSTMKLETYYRIAGSSEPSSHTWTFSNTLGAAGGIVAFRGVDTAAPIDASGGQVNASSTLITAPSITTTVPDTALVGSFGLRGDTAIAPPSGMTERWDRASNAGSSKITSAGATEGRATTGATGERVASADKGAPSIGHLVALKPVGN
jgi:hypothetical protein